ncbi:MAG: sodium:solute symporter [Cyanobacteriota bacterium]
MEYEFPVHNIDLVVIGIYFLIVTIIAVIVSMKTKTGEDLFLAGRSLGWGVIGLSLFASNISSSTLIGLSGQAYNTGISVSNYEWMAIPVLVLIALFFIPFFINNKISTTPEFLENRFNVKCRKYFSIQLIFTNIVVDIAGGLYAGAIVLQMFFPFLTIWELCLIIALFCGIYTAFGGLKAVVYTDVLQTIVLFIGSCLLTYYVFEAVNFSWHNVVSNTPPEMLSVIRPIDDPTLPWLGTLIGLPILGFYYWATNQFIVQRVLAAKDLNNARWGLMLAALMKLPVLFIMVMPGVVARLFLPELEKADLVFPTLIVHLMPAGVVGLILAGLIAAIMSSVDSTLNAASTLLSLDFIKPKYPHLTETDMAKIGKYVTLGFMVLSVIWAPMIGMFPTLFEYLQGVLAYIVPPVAAIYLLGIFWPRGNATGAFTTFIVGHSVAVIFFILVQMDIINLHFSIIAGILFAISVINFVIASLLTTAPDREVINKFVFNKLSVKPAGAIVIWYKDYRYQSAVLLILTVILVVTFW